jgi:hypothetical protein
MQDQSESDVIHSTIRYFLADCSELRIFRSLDIRILHRKRCGVGGASLSLAVSRGE